MNKTAIKNFAIWARVQLIESAKQRAYEYEITENGENKSGLYAIGGRLLTKTEKDQRDQRDHGSAMPVVRREVTADQAAHDIGAVVQHIQNNVVRHCRQEYHGNTADKTNKSIVQE